MAEGPRYDVGKPGLRVKLLGGPLDGAEASLWTSMLIEVELDRLVALLLDGAKTRREPGSYRFDKVEDYGKRVVYAWQPASA